MLYLAILRYKCTRDIGNECISFLTPFDGSSHRVSSRQVEGFVVFFPIFDVIFYLIFPVGFGFPQLADFFLFTLATSFFYKVNEKLICSLFVIFE